MPTRKLVKHGPSSYIVSLPRAWVTKNGLRKGDDIQYEVSPKRVSFYAPNAGHKRGKFVDISGLDPSSISLLLRALYRRGFVDIKAEFDQVMVDDYETKSQRSVSSIVDEEARKLVGISIASHSRNEIHLKQLAEPSLDELSESATRVLSLLSGMFDEIVVSLQSYRFEELATSEEKHDTIAMLVNYLIRGYNNSKTNGDTPFILHILMTLDIVTDILKIFSRMVRQAKLKPSSEFIEVLKLYRQIHEITLMTIADFRYENVKQIGKLHQEARVKVKDLKVNEQSLMHFLLPTFELNKDLIQARMCASNASLFSNFTA